MDIRIYPRAVPTDASHPAAGDRLHVWLGVFGAAAAPPIQWFLNGRRITPTPLLPLDSARSSEPGTALATRTLAAVYEFSGLEADRLYDVAVVSGSRRRSIQVRTLPEHLSKDVNHPLNVLLVSCYYQPEDRNELVGAVVRQLTGMRQPHLILLLGDQVYLDLPTLKRFKDDAAWLAQEFERTYVRNWLGPGGLGAILASAPSIHIPEDHEYWNNAPHYSPVVTISRSAAGRQRWRLAAEMVYRGFQLSAARQLGDPVMVDIPPLSFFMADTRSHRTDDRRAVMTPEARRMLADWCDRVAEQQLFGVFAAGQSLYDAPAGSFRGRIADYTLANYGDYAAVMRSLLSVPERGRPILCLTGDVHWGRVVRTMDVARGRAALYEVISSPSALVSSIGLDQLKHAVGFVGGLLGRSDPWPRHAAHKTPPDFLATQVVGKRYRSEVLGGQTGDHVTLLSFTRAGHGVDVSVTHYPIHERADVRRPVTVGPLRLRPF